MPTKIDFKTTLDCYKAARGTFRIVDVPRLQYLMLDGHGDPNTSPAFNSAVRTLFPLAYKLKFASKRSLGKDYVVMPLEGLWWADDMDSFTVARDKSNWDWTLMIMQPDWITQAMFEEAVRNVGENDPLHGLDQVRLEMLTEGRCVQTLHVGSYDDEAATLATMHHEFIPNQKLAMVKHHHEIYLSDFRKVAPAKLRTILRQPVEDEAEIS